MGRIDVGDEEKLKRTLRIRSEREIGHHGAEIASADADVDDIAYAPAGETAPLAAAHEIAKIPHLFENRPHAGHNVLAVDDKTRLRVAVAQSRMQHGAVLRAVYFFTGEHTFDFGLEPGRLSHPHKSLHRLRVNPVFGIVEMPAGRIDGKLLSPRGIFGEELSDCFL